MDAPRWRAMEVADLPAVVAIAALVHPDFYESPVVFADKRTHFRNGCFVLGAPAAVTGYAIAHPWRGAPPALNHLLGAPPQAPDYMYVHDIALAPVARRRGAAAAIVERIAGLARETGLDRLELVAVNGSAPVWRRLGFRDKPGPAPTSYGPDARAMSRDL